MKDANRRERELMVESQIRSRGVNDPGVLEAMCNVPRERFVIDSQRHYAFSDGPLPIGNGQTISQPYIVAYMTELLEMKGTETVLELGTGSGYQTAVLAEVAEHVYTVEVIEELSGIAKEKLLDMNYKNISFRVGNGKEGWKEHAPFDRIMLTAAPAHFPQELFAQLKENGIIVAPVGSFFQRMMLYRKIDGKIEEKGLIAVSFVPFV
ncbi:MAG: protein-L-isoaspartate(D-aspartate) O-methyltransferase [bacterium]|nr:protein-L-isoaspartate(D-aspartate) O-methyltransferase [bacterium]